uniref:Uncharacterized protein n=1 Tax=Glossina brevipalpis TaxID=37001 RepID=A0A1A9WEL5_9MUSC
MANITYHREFSELSPVLYTSLSNHIPPESNDDSVLILWDDHHHSHYNIFEYHDAATILIMIVAWFLLILGLTLCCCSQCINGALGGLSKRISNEAVDNSNSNSNRNVCITIPECDQSKFNNTLKVCPKYKDKKLSTGKKMKKTV